jgi:hypothetical protein
MATVRERIDGFLAARRIAVLGLSRSRLRFSRLLYAELRRRGYDLVPVNPKAREIEGQKCFARIQDVTPPVDAALLMTSAEVTDGAVRDCAAAGVRRVWLYRAVGRGALTPAAVQFCEQNGIEVVPGFCPFMFLPGAGFLHGAHRFFLKLTGAYPA